jgi:hypothetical protein
MQGALGEFLLQVKRGILPAAVRISATVGVPFASSPGGGVAARALRQRQNIVRVGVWRRRIVAGRRK